MRTNSAGRFGVGDEAPDFALSSGSGDIVRLRDLIGEKAVVLYFYPRDGTPGCTAEACSFRDGYEDFLEASPGSASDADHRPLRHAPTAEPVTPRNVR
jgi:thioredoxin-dependent peroxiredoxin